MSNDNINIEELKKKVEAALKTVYDPEIPVNIYELGLIYDIQITQFREAVILMTLTAPSCPEAEILPPVIEMKVKSIPGITNVKVLLTFDPPWDNSMMSDAAKLELGLF